MFPPSPSFVYEEMHICLSLRKRFDSILFKLRDFLIRQKAGCCFKYYLCRQLQKRGRRLQKLWPNMIC